MERIFSFHKSETGENHKKTIPSKPCEDYSDHLDAVYHRTDGENIDYHICVVADGHGSDNYPRTDKGSKYAVESCMQKLKEFVETVEGISETDEESREEFILSFVNDPKHNVLTGLAHSILQEWANRVQDDIKNEPFSEEELSKVSEKYKERYLAEEFKIENIRKAYGCTLIAFLITKDYSFGLQIGDGKCIMVDDAGDFSEPIPWDENCSMNITTSICDNNAGDEFRFYATKKSPVAIFCGSDGIDDSYTSMEEVYAFYRTILEIFIEEGREVGQQEIEEYLPTLTRKGSGDDVSVATIIDLERAKCIAPLLDIQAENYKLTAEEEKTKKSKEGAWFKLNELADKGISFLTTIRKSKNRMNVNIDNFGESEMGTIHQLLKDIDAYDQTLSELQEALIELQQKKDAIVETIQYDKEAALFERIDDEGAQDISYEENTEHAVQAQCQCASDIIHDLEESKTNDNADGINENND